MSANREQIQIAAQSSASQAEMDVLKRLQTEISAELDAHLDRAFKEEL